jgi:hypothetical protein
VGRDGEKEGGSLGSLRRADRSEVKTKRADWQDLLSDSADKQASSCGSVFLASWVLRASSSYSAGAILTAQVHSTNAQQKQELPPC